MCHVFYRRFRLAGESRLKLWYDYFFDRCYFRSFCCVVEEEVYGKGRQEHEQLIDAWIEFRGPIWSPKFVWSQLMEMCELKGKCRTIAPSVLLGWG